LAVVSRQSITSAIFYVLVLFSFGISNALAETHFLDLSKAANRGFEESFDETSGVEDIQNKEGLRSLSMGSQTFRGIPFQILDPSHNGNHSFIALKGREKPDFPEAVSLPTGHLKAAYLYFLHTCRWGGTASDIKVAEYDIVYDDGQVEVIPLRVGKELTNFYAAEDTPSNYLAWWHKYKNTDMGIGLYPWENPRPDKSIQSILFKSLSKMPVPLLFAITASDKELPVSPDSPKPEKTYKTDTTDWIPFEPSGVSPSGTAIDMSFLLDAPAGKHGKVKADGDKLVFEDGTPARFWGVKLDKNLYSINPENFDQLSERLASIGCNLVEVDESSEPWQELPTSINVLMDALKVKGIYMVFGGEEKFLPAHFLEDPAIISKNLFVWGHANWNNVASKGPGPVGFQDFPMVLAPEDSIPAQAILKRSLGSPYGFEWSVGWPNEYLSEAPLLISSYSTYEGWSAVAGMALSGSNEAQAIVASDSLEDKPFLLAQWPVAVLAYLRGDLKEGKVFVLDKDGSPLKGLAHQSGLQPKNGKFKTDVGGQLKAKINEKTKSFVSDTGQISWQGNVGVVKVESPRLQAIIGFLGNRPLNNPYWKVETPNLFASLSLISLTDKSITASDHLLITGVTRMENTGMVYNAAKTKLISAGKAPILVEPLKAQFVLYRFKKDTGLKVRALDANGAVLKTKVPTKWIKNNLVFSWLPSAFYLEITKTP
jgi:hypothetical protein